MNDKEYSYYVYILTNEANTVFYTGVTNDIIRRIVEHKIKIHNGFSSKYNVTKLVYYEHFTDVHNAIEREKKLKKWNREWKWRLIRKVNSGFRDLIYDFAVMLQMEMDKGIS
jgi:putative endonuclease